VYSKRLPCGNGVPVEAASPSLTMKTSAPAARLETMYRRFLVLAGMTSTWVVPTATVECARGVAVLADIGVPPA
jgi:hypothetical protein